MRFEDYREWGNVTRYVVFYFWARLFGFIAQQLPPLLVVHLPYEEMEWAFQLCMQVAFGTDSIICIVMAFYVSGWHVSQFALLSANNPQHVIRKYAVV